ncbi:hypothetical protein ScPMuIL_011454 [Solemya velum]
MSRSDGSDPVSMLKLLNDPDVNMIDLEKPQISTIPPDNTQDTDRHVGKLFASMGLNEPHTTDTNPSSSPGYKQDRGSVNMGSATMPEQVELDELGIMQIDYLAKSLGSNYKDTARNLGVDWATLEDLKTQYNTLPYERNYNLIISWKNSEGKNGTLEKLRHLLSPILAGICDEIPEGKLSCIYGEIDDKELSQTEQATVSRTLGQDYTRFLRLLGVSDSQICDGLLRENQEKSKPIKVFNFGKIKQ